MRSSLCQPVTLRLALPTHPLQASYEQLEEVPASVPQGVDEILEVGPTGWQQKMAAQRGWWHGLHLAHYSVPSLATPSYTVCCWLSLPAAPPARCLCRRLRGSRALRV